jgi:hypothetical protein
MKRDGSFVQGKAPGSDPLVSDDGPCFHVMQMSEHTSFGRRTSYKGQSFLEPAHLLGWKMDASSLTGKAGVGYGFVASAASIRPLKPTRVR